MRIETTEHGRRIVIDIDREGVRIRVFSTDPGPVIAYGGGWQPGDNCPVCGQRHNPKEHAGGAGSPAAADERAAREEA